MNDERVLLIGAGAMAIEYAKTLANLGITPVVMGRGEQSAAAFSEATGLPVGTGPLDQQLAGVAELPKVAIVTVNAMFLTDATTTLIKAGVIRLLVEKPAALDRAELDRLTAVANDEGAEVALGYNRRYASSVRRARDMVDEDGGVVSVKFDFSEPSRRIATLDKPERELLTWFYGNSSHVVDLALHFSGGLTHLSAMTAGGVDWHPQSGIFVGHGRGANGALVSWHSNWVGPGRWGLEVVTAERRLIMQPLEQLRIQTHDGFAETPVEIDMTLDQEFKPGLMRQVRAFLSGEEADHLCSLDEHRSRFDTYEVIRTGSTNEKEAMNQ